MLVKKFEAPSMEQALTLIKREMGPNALILSTTKKPGSWFKRGIVEVTAAYENKAESTRRDHFDEDELKKVFPSRRGDSGQPPAEPSGTMAPAGSRYLDAVKGDSSVSPQDRLRTIPTSRYEGDFTRAGFGSDSAKELSRRLVLDFPSKDLGDPAFLLKTKQKLLVTSLKTISLDIFESKSSWAAIGPPGAGKTSLLVKLAIFLRERKRGVKLVSCDQRKVIGRSELSAYSRLIQVPFSTDGKPAAGTIELVDTPSMQPGDNSADEEIARATRDRHSVLVLDASMRSDECRRVLERAEKFAPSAVAFTKLDCIGAPGAIFDVLRACKLPLLGLSLSGAFRDSVKFFEANELADYLMGPVGNA